MKVKFCCDNHANIHSKRERVFDTCNDLGFDDDEWRSLSEDDKHKIVEEWALEQFDFWIEEN